MLGCPCSDIREGVKVVTWSGEVLGLPGSWDEGGALGLQPAGTGSWDIHLFIKSNIHNNININ